MGFHRLQQLEEKVVRQYNLQVNACFFARRVSFVPHEGQKLSKNLSLQRLDDVAVGLEGKRLKGLGSFFLRFCDEGLNGDDCFGSISVLQHEEANECVAFIRGSESADHTTESQDLVKSALLLDVVVRESSSVLQLLASKNETLVARKCSLLVLKHELHFIDCVLGFHVQSDGFPLEVLHKDLHCVPE